MNDTAGRQAMGAGRVTRRRGAGLAATFALLPLCAGLIGCSETQGGADQGGGRDGAPADLAQVVKDVVINEVFPHGADELTDPDWVELKNVSAAAVDLSGYRVRDDKNMASLPSGTKIMPGAYLLLYCDDVPDGGAQDRLHLPFKLGGMNDEFHLLRGDGAEIDGITWGMSSIPAGQSYGRLPDGTGQFGPLNPTPGKRNGV